MKRLGLLAAFGLLFQFAHAQMGQQFPKLDGETVTNTRVKLPADVKGKYTLLGLAFSKQSEDELESWFQPTYERFMRDKKEAGLFADFAYDVNLYFIPMFTGVKKAMAGKARKQALKNVDPALHPFILFYAGQLEPYRDSLKLEEKTPYFFVLNPDGKIVYMTEGRYTAKKMGEIEEILSQ